MHNAGNSFNVTGVISQATGDWGYAAGAWDGSVGKLVAASGSGTGVQSSAHPTSLFSLALGQNGGLDIEGVLVYDRMLSDNDIRWIGGMENAWTPDNTYFYAVEINDETTVLFGSGRMLVETTSTSTIAALIAFDRPLTEAEIQRLDAIPTSELTWANVARPEKRVMIDGQVVRVAHKVKYGGVLRDVHVEQ